MFKPLLIAAYYLATRADWRVALQRLWSFARLFWRRRYPHLRSLRLPHCQKCAMFSPMQTCGYLGEMQWVPETRRVEPLGCWCWMPLASQIKTKDCWLREKGNAEGWPDDLRP